MRRAAVMNVRCTSSSISVVGVPALRRTRATKSMCSSTMRRKRAERSAASSALERGSGAGRTPEAASTSRSLSLIARLIMGFFSGPISDSRSDGK